MKTVSHALKTVFAEPIAWLQAIVISLALFALLFMIPVWTTPGNDVAFQWHIIEPGVLFLMALLSVLNGILFTMHLHIRRHGKAGNVGKGGKAKGATTLLGIAATSFASTIACAACYSSVLAIFGLSGTIFVVTHRWWFAGGAVLLSSYATYQTSRKINHECNACEIKI